LGIKRLLRILLASHHKNEELLNADEKKRKEGWTYPIEPCWGCWQEYEARAFNG
jgi:hypothetical protein